MKKILLSLVTIVAVGTIVTQATTAYFSDTAEVLGNTFSAGSLDLQVGGKDTGIENMVLTNMVPGDSTGYRVYCLKNSGTVAGDMSVKFGSIDNQENVVIQPESLAESNPVIGFTEGELGQYLKRTVGWGPCGWSVPSQVISDWTAGPAHPWGTPALNGTANQTFTYATALSAGSEIGFFVKLDLESDLRRWDGTKWLDVDDNIIQTDRAVFDMIFNLDQVE